MHGSDSLKAHGFRYCFTPLREVLFTFPSRYWYTIGLRRVFSLGGWARRIHTGFHVPRATQVHGSDHSGLRVRVSHPLRTHFPERSARPSCALRRRDLQPRTRKKKRARFGLCPVRSPLLGVSRLFSLPPGTKMFQFPGFASTLQMWMTVLQTAGLPHSDIGGSRAACASPPLFAACHVFHRLPEPRHPPCALSFVRLHRPVHKTRREVYSPAAAKRPRRNSNSLRFRSRDTHIRRVSLSFCSSVSKNERTQLNACASSGE